MAAAMAMAEPALSLENAKALLLGSLEDKDAGIAKEPKGSFFVGALHQLAALGFTFRQGKAIF